MLNIDVAHVTVCHFFDADANGVKQSITQKCSDLDKHVPELLGVTSAVMAHVVFCHQEGEFTFML